MDGPNGGQGPLPGHDRAVGDQLGRVDLLLSTAWLGHRLENLELLRSWELSQFRRRVVDSMGVWRTNGETGLERLEEPLEEETST